AQPRHPAAGRGRQPVRRAHAGAGAGVGRLGRSLRLRDAQSVAARAPHPPDRGRAMSGAASELIAFSGISKFYGEVLGVNKIERVGMTPAAGRKIAGYSKGMRQRIKLAQAICHRPRVLLLDEPLNGLDPLARAEVIALFRALAADGLHVVLSSHILHEVDLLS